MRPKKTSILKFCSGPLQFQGLWLGVEGIEGAKRRRSAALGAWARRARGARALARVVLARLPAARLAAAFSRLARAPRTPRASSSAAPLGHGGSSKCKKQYHDIHTRCE